MKNQTRMFIYIVAAVILFLGAFQYFSQGKVNLTLPDLGRQSIFKPEGSLTPVESLKVENVSIDFGNGQKLTGQVSTQSAYQALVQVAKDNNKTVEVKQYKYGIMVTKVGDAESKDSAGWVYSVNGKQGQIAADRYIIYPGDQVLWEFKKF